jgi:HD-GYP domain-containing protein (c-di-GMP phosphodiesterase class II)
VLHHHERWDGDGYPDRLRGEEIPLGARIILVADAYDAMTSERVYREPRSAREAFEELDRCSGSQFDPAIIDAFSEELGVRSRVIELVS